jgi:hypothetical protein
MMQWFGRGKEEDPEDFWRSTAARRGGEIGFLTFATLLGRSGDRPLDLPGLLYVVGDMVWFEDFERDNWLAKIVGGRKKFEKTELSFGREEIRSSQLVSRSAAIRCIGGVLSVDKLRTVSAWARIFSTPIVQVSLSNGTTLFFDMIRRNEFISQVAGAAAAAPRPAT